MQAPQAWRVIWRKMPTSCNFYVLPDADNHKRLLFCCALIEKICAHGHSIYVHCTNQDEAERFDALLWTFKDVSFIAHGLCGQYSLADAPVQIGCEKPPISASMDVLIFLAVSSELPDFYTQFGRVVDIVNQDAVTKEKLRLRYQKYRSLGLVVNTHTI